MRKVLFFFTGLCLAGLLLLAAGIEPGNPAAARPTETAPVTESTVQIPLPTEATEDTESTELSAETEPAETALFMAVEQLERYNFELQQYIPSQTEIDGNVIRLTAIRENDQYYSGKAESTMAFRYGTFSFRIRTTRKEGFFPAIWMLPADGARLPEVDIYEAIGSEPRVMYGVIHRTETDWKKEYFAHRITREQRDGSYVLTFVWTEDSLTWSVDGEVVATITGECPTMPMYMICNLAMGGTWAGAPRHADFPEVYEIEILEFSPEETFPR